MLDFVVCGICGQRCLAESAQRLGPGTLARVCVGCAINLGDPSPPSGPVKRMDPLVSYRAKNAAFHSWNLDETHCERGIAVAEREELNEPLDPTE